LDDAAFATVVLCAATLMGVLWGGAILAALLTGHPLPRSGPATPLLALAHPTRLRHVWGQDVAPTRAYWGVTIALAATAVGIALAARHAVRHHQHARQTDPRRLEGIATRRDVARAAGHTTLLRKRATLRPSLTRAAPSDLGHRLGRSRGVDCYTSVEDSMVLLGPPRAGKGLHVVIPMILDAPGAVLTTSTRPDNLTATLKAREATGPVAVFDPQRLAPGIPSATRWSPIRGCQDPQVALVRAKALATKVAAGTTDANFWQSSAEQAVRCLLHAAALAGASSADLYRWSLSAVAAREAVLILANHPAAAAAWDQALEAITSADTKQRDSIWAMVGIAFAALADPRVLDAVSPGPDQQFDPEMFLRSRGTIYLLGTSTGAAATAGLVGAFVEDVLEAARRLAASSPGARLDPPLSVILDEAANYPLPSLTSLMSEGGGTGINPLVVLQSLAQARAVWGEHAAGAMWDSAIVKLILGGGSNARDLNDLSKLIGPHTHQETTQSTGPDGKRSTTSPHQVPILEPARLRTLPFGTGILLLRSAPPIVLTLTGWPDRPDARRLAHDQTGLEAVIRHAHTSRI
jgi:type IV secretory pathway TraG/TraD family ATPase VirD4